MVIQLLRLKQEKRQEKEQWQKELRQQMEILEKYQFQQNQLVTGQIARQNESVIKGFSVLGNDLRTAQEKQQERNREILQQLQQEMQVSRMETLSVLEKIRQTNSEHMERLQRENRESLEAIHVTVNEKLQKTLEERISRSFETVNRRLAEVYEGLGEMKNVASGVTDLKKVLSNVKTRGILGEIQLGAILQEILAPEQYAEQVSICPLRPERVDYAVKLPGNEDGEIVYLPIDAKFPGDTYAKLQEAYENGDTAECKSCRAVLETEMKRCAKSIQQKYIMPPYTTDFAIMFLPFEGLYAEVINMGLMEVLQKQYKINVAGPSTMAAMLNSLQMGFRTLAIQKKSGDVWKILEEAKKEFATFESALQVTRKRLRQADEELEKMIGTRTRAINRKLKDVSVLDVSNESEPSIGINETMS